MIDFQVPEAIKLDQEWLIGDRLGEGGFAFVYAASSEDREPAVIKFIPKDPGAERELLFENLSGVPNVVPVLDIGEWDSYWILVMPKAKESLRDHILGESAPLSLHSTVDILTDVSEALVSIEEHVVHRDLKPENILLLNGHWCLADFGISRYAEATTAPDTRKHAMTPQYAAPEQWRSERATSATDVYATGVIAYELLAGKLPFQGPGYSDFRHQHLDTDPESIPNTPPRLRSLVTECLYKAPEARPRPQDLLVRLRTSLEPASRSASRLQQANQRVVDQQAEVARIESVARSEGDRRNRLRIAADKSLEHVVGLLHDQVVANAPASSPVIRPAMWSCTLNEAEFRIELAKSAELPQEEVPYSPPFEIIAFASITLRILPNAYEYEGRSHSLWFCDAKEQGVFRWYEAAFMISPFMSKRTRINPFALVPGQEAYKALSNVITEFQVAWPFTSIDQGDENGFIERWMDWFADAAEGRLDHPTYMPEQSTKGTWRKG